MKIRIRPEAIACVVTTGVFAGLAGLAVWLEVRNSKILRNHKEGYLAYRDIPREIDEASILNDKITLSSDKAFVKDYLEDLYRHMLNSQSISNFDEYLRKYDLYISSLKTDNCSSYVEYLKLKAAQRTIAEQQAVALKQSENIADAIKSLSRVNGIEVTV